MIPSAPRGAGRDVWWVSVLFAALTLALTYPLSLHPGSTSLTNDPDIHTMTWTIAWDGHALVRRPWALFDANIFHPYAHTLAFSENLIGSALLVAPLLWITGNPVLAMNAAALLSCVLCGLGAYVLARRLGLSTAAAIVGGVIFAFSPARFLRFPQLHLTAIQWIPFTLAFLIAYLDGGRRRDLWLAIGALTLQVLASGHGAVYVLIAVAALVVYRLAIGTPLLLRQRLRDAGLVGLLLLAPAAAIVPPYLRVQQEHGLRRSLENWETAPASFLASPTHLHAWLIERVFDPSISTSASAFLFPGYLPLLLAAAALLPGRRTVPWHLPWFLAALTAIAVWLSIGPPLSIWPYVYWLPGLNFIRVPSRFFLLAMVGLAALAAVGADRVLARLHGLPRRAAAVAMAAWLIAEFAMVPLPVHDYRVAIPAIDRWLDTQPKPFAIAEVPVGPYTRYHSTYMLHSMAHWQKTVHGHSSLLPVPLQSLYGDLRTFPDHNSIRKLVELRVDYVVVHTDMYAPGEWPLVEQRIAQHGDRLTLRHVEGAGRVYALRWRD